MIGSSLGTALGALAVSATGMVLAAGTAVFAASAEITPWAQVGGTATAVGALAYVAKMLADGRLVAQPVADLIRHADARETKLVEVLADAKEREDAFRAWLMTRGAGRS